MVTLAPVERPEPEEVTVQLAPPASGLGTFDLGSVPASVTPPRSWRRAAWFATASSGGVVVALLFAGSALVGKPAPDEAGTGWVPGLDGGGQPALGDGQQAPDPGQGATGPDSRLPTKAAEPTNSSTSLQPGADVRHPAGDGAPGHDDPAPVSSAPTNAAPAPAHPYLPPKPAEKPAPYDTDPFKVGLPQGAPAVFAEDSQKFFETVTENPEAAYAMTTGDLQSQGKGALAHRYAGVAYFDVQHVQVHQYEGKTICTMQTVYKDGSRTTEQRVLTFSHGKIKSAT